MHGFKRNSKLELFLIGILILLLLVIVFPEYINIVEKTKATEAKNNIESVYCSVERYWYDQNCFADFYIRATFDRIDIDNPNNTKNRFYKYTLLDNSTLETKNYGILAERIDKEKDYWLKWVQLDKNNGKWQKSF